MHGLFEFRALHLKFRVLGSRQAFPWVTPQLVVSSGFPLAPPANRSNGVHTYGFEPIMVSGVSSKARKTIDRPRHGLEYWHQQDLLRRD